jgi:hypothetical protein
LDEIAAQGKHCGNAKNPVVQHHKDHDEGQADLHSFCTQANIFGP